MFSLISLFTLTLFLLQINKIEADACNSLCYNDQHPKCHVTLKENNVQNATGVYQIFDGLIHFSCTFESLPNPVEIHWTYRSKSETKLHTVPCAKTSVTQNCSIDDENRVQEECFLRLNHLDLSGQYSCEGSLSNGMVVSSQPANIEVIGIELAEISSTKLHRGEDGFVEIRICAYPKPELFWILPNKQFLKPGESQGKFSAAQLTSVLHRKPLADETTPSHYEPYCYSNRIVIGQVEDEDKELDVIVRNSGETRQLKLNLRTQKSFGVNSREMYSNLVVFVVLMNVINFI